MLIREAARDDLHAIVALLRDDALGQIEGVRIAASHRGQGLGQALFDDLIDRAKSHNCRIVQLTTNKSRPDAIAFYQRLGFEPTHEGMKLYLDNSAV